MDTPAPGRRHRLQLRDETAPTPTSPDPRTCSAPATCGRSSAACPRRAGTSAVNQRLARVGLLGRLHYYGSWVDHLDARSARQAEAPVLSGRFVLDLEVAVALTLSVGGQNVLDTYSDRMDLFGARFGLPYSSSRRGASAAATTTRASATAGGGSRGAGGPHRKP